MNKFSWGKVIDNFSYDFDGQIMNITKYHPWKRDGFRLLSGNHDESIINFHCEELHESSESLQYLIIAWIANKNLGLNNGALVYGIAKALDIIKS